MACVFRCSSSPSCIDCFQIHICFHYGTSLYRSKRFIHESCLAIILFFPNTPVVEVNTIMYLQTGSEFGLIECRTHVNATNLPRTLYILASLV